MIALLGRWMKANSVILVNAGALAGTTACTSVLGFVYWWLAAREFSPDAVGTASALVSAMMLLGNCCMLGMGTLLITELPRQPTKAPSLISTALLAVGGAGGCVGVAFALVAGYLSVGFQPLSASAIDIAIFAAGVTLSSVTLVLDQALVGLLLGSLQLGRNVLFAVAKLAILFVAGLVLLHASGITIYTTWAAGSAFSLLALAAYTLFKRGALAKDYLPQWRVLRKLSAPALLHHLLNLALQGPMFILPMLVTVLLSVRMNAWFYVSWMLASFIFTISFALTTVLHATNSAQHTTVARKVRLTMGLAFLISLSANCLLQSGAKYILGLFGGSYAEQAVWTLRILALSAFPLIIRNHYLSICRIQDHITRALRIMLPGAFLELSAAAIGARLGGLSGLSLGWCIAICLEAMVMFPVVYKALEFKNLYLPVAAEPPVRVDQHLPAAEFTARIETGPVRPGQGLRNDR